MFDLTMPGMVGLYMGAWGFSNALSRLTDPSRRRRARCGDAGDRPRTEWISRRVWHRSADALHRRFMLYRIDVNAFKKQIEEPSYVEKVALAAE